MRKVLELFALTALILFVSAALGNSSIVPIFYWTGVIVAIIAEGLLIFKGFQYIKKEYKNLLK